MNPLIVRCTYLWSLLTLVILLSTGCTKKTAGPQRTQDITRSISVKSLLNKWDTKAPDYKHAHGSTRVGVAFDGQRYRATGSFIHHRGEVIYMTVKKLGFELGEVWITPDSFHMINRLLNEYISEPLSTLEAEYHIKADFELLEELVSGLPTISSDLKKKKTTYRDGMHIVQNDRGEDIDVTLRFTPAIQLQDALYSDQSSRRISLTYEDWDRDLISRRVETANIDDGHLVADLSYHKVGFTKKDIPTFDPPRNYDRTSL